MGNTESFWGARRESKKEQASLAPAVPEISVTEASPVSAEGFVFPLPSPETTGSTGQADSDPAAHIHVVSGCGNPEGSRQPETDDADDEGPFDTCSLSGSEGNSSRQHFIQVMMDRSPQVRRSMVLRRSLYLPSRSDSDSVSMLSSILDEDRTAVTLDPLEHEWMMCASDGEWGSLNRLLATDPSLILRKDFVSGFTCLHWAAKLGNPELIALVINFAMQYNIPINIDVRSNTGYTPLHIAAMHNHMEVVKILVGAYNADVEIRDYSGRKACQYLTDIVSVDIRDIIGAYEQSNSENTDCRDRGLWRFSKVLQSNLRPLRLLNPSDWDSVDGQGRIWQKPLRRMSSLSRMRPKLQRLRLRTSQIVHSTSFRDPEELEGSGEGFCEPRPKTHFFG
ncbi:ankyrin repeat domain-containing protein SOWAHC-like [Hippoglossus stenolepis]|uniref:ankyrin repeat domain-containing protein SOWAHC-like n=1 Tax=Hippoglossus stenolepis TaxID=195615 RepID=UPI001FB0447D|nr:ankyrin repeat domain-containing protein SOWAHC-like [Hippoglossus stenolepis]